MCMMRLVEIFVGVSARARNTAQALFPDVLSSKDLLESLKVTHARAFANHRNLQAADELLEKLRKTELFPALAGGRQASEEVVIDTRNAHTWADFVLNTLLTNASSSPNGACGSLRKPPTRLKKGRGIVVVTYGLGDADNEWEAIPAAINALYAVLHGYDFVRLTPFCDAGPAASTLVALQAKAKRVGHGLPDTIHRRDEALSFLWDVALPRRHQLWTALLAIDLALEHFEFALFLGRTSYVAQLASSLQSMLSHLGPGKLVLAPDSVLRINSAVLLNRPVDAAARAVGGGSALLLRSSDTTKELVDAWWNAPLEESQIASVNERWKEMAAKFASEHGANALAEENGKTTRHNTLATGGAPKCDSGCDRHCIPAATLHDLACQNTSSSACCLHRFLFVEPLYEACLHAVLEHPRYSPKVALVDNVQGEGLFGGERGLFVRRCNAEPAARMGKSHAVPRGLHHSVEAHMPTTPPMYVPPPKARRDKEAALQYESQLMQPPPPTPPPLPPPPPAPVLQVESLGTEVRQRFSEQIKAREVLNHAFFCSLKNFVRPPSMKQTCYYETSMRKFPEIYGRKRQ